jgi:rod shape determining protein RodA
MVSGTIPVVGVTLPLISYGGSSVLTIAAGLGLVMNVSVRRYSY